MGIGPRAAAVIGAREMFFAVISTTATLAAVFVPISFLPGQAGGLFREFGYVLAAAVVISSFIALTLCPMLAATFLKAHEDERKPGFFTRGIRWIGGSWRAFTPSPCACASPFRSSWSRRRPCFPSAPIPSSRPCPRS